MRDDKYETTNRRAIGIALSVWLGAQLLTLFDPSSVPLTASALAATGLISMPLLLLWPWIRPSPMKIAHETQRAPRSPEIRHKALISVEIVALSALLICLTLRTPP